MRSSRVFNDGVGLELVQNYRKHRRKHAEPIPSEYVSDGPVLENVLMDNQVDILAFPAPKWHGDDGGQYIGTECMVIAQDPDNGWVNAGTYRVSVRDKRTLSIFIEPGKHADTIRKKWWARGEHCPMVVTVGQAPALGAAAAATAAGERQRVRRRRRADRPADQAGQGPRHRRAVPERCRARLRGLHALARGTDDGRGAVRRMAGLLRLVRARSRCCRSRRSIIATTRSSARRRRRGRSIRAPISAPPAPALIRAASLWDDLEAAGVPGIKGVWKMPGGGSRFINVIAIEQMHAGHAKMAGLVAAGCGSSTYLGRIIIIVDDDIDITNPAEVMWAVGTRWDPKTATDIIDGVWTGYIDPMLLPERRAKGDLTNSRIIIYAVRPYAWKDEFPKVNAVDPAYAAEVARKWAGKLKFLDDL